MNAMNPNLDAVMIDGARVVLGDRFEHVSLRIERGLITGIETAADGATRVDARGMVLAPAMIDIHGDAFERQLMPRPGVMLPMEAALLETDRQLAANGIATAYHALTLSWEPGLRSVQTGWEMFEALTRLAPRLTVENRLQLRWETFCFEALPLIEASLAGPLMPSIAFNDHTSMAVLHPGTPLQSRPFDHDPAFPVVDMDSAAFAEKMDARAKRSHMSASAFVDLMKAVWSRRADVLPVIADVAAKGRAAGAPMLSHDDSQPETRGFYRDHGARISEFPMNLPTAQAARDAGDWIIFGAPNAARGGSHLGSPGAADMIRLGLCDILASDYYYPAMLAAIARLQADGVGNVPDLWRLVADTPAKALNLHDRGRIAPGMRADLVLIDWPEGGTPAPRATWVAGKPAYRAMALG
jgi:alpha-D-ribose 1-methylphosphonate 5-triphosphate diphosphatase